MSSKAIAASKTALGKVEKNPIEICKKPLTLENDKIISQTSTASVPKSVDDCSTLIEVTVKTKGRKPSCTMVSSNQNNHKAIEEKRSSGNGESYQKWGHIFGEQNRTNIKESLQQLVTRNKTSKSAKRGIDNKECKKTTDSTKQRKRESSRVQKYVNEVPRKQTASQKKSAEVKTTVDVAGPSTTSVTSSMESVLVVDRAVQCGGVFDCSNERFGVFNPVRTIGFLMKELEDLVKDERSSKILTDMEQALLRIPMDTGKPSPVDLEVIALRAKLDSTTSQLEEMSKVMNTMCESLRERDLLQCQVQKQAMLLEEAQLRQIDSDAAIQSLTEKLNDAIKTIDVKEKKISELKEENRNIEVSHKVITDLKLELDKQSELARQRHLEIQYLMLEKDKLSVLSSYKDTLLEELRTAVKDLQNRITQQLVGLKETYNYEETVEPQSSVVRSGFACSSLTPTSSEHSNIVSSWQDVSDVSLSIMDQNACTEADVKKTCFDQEKDLPRGKTIFDDIEKETIQNYEQSKSEDNMHLEFISIPGEEISNTILFSGYKEPNAVVEESENAVDLMPPERLRDLSEKRGKKKIVGKNTLKGAKSVEHNKSKDNVQKVTVSDDTLTFSNICNDPVSSNVKEQFQNMFEDMRLQNRISIDVPSPLRDFPRSDWNNSSLPSISAVSGTNLEVQSNDT